MKKLKEKTGYISLETVIILGLLVTIGTIFTIALFAKGNLLQDQSFIKINAINII